MKRSSVGVSHTCPAAHAIQSGCLREPDADSVNAYTLLHFSSVVISFAVVWVQLRQVVWVQFRQVVWVQFREVVWVQFREVVWVQFRIMSRINTWHSLPLSKLCSPSTHN